MNRLEHDDKCIPADYQEWKWVAELLEYHGIPTYRKYSEEPKRRYDEFPALCWSEENQISGSWRSTTNDKLLSTTEFLLKAGINPGNHDNLVLLRQRYKHNGGKKLKHRFV